MEHLSYEAYVSLGGSVPEARFSMLERRANRIVDAMTHGRLADESPLRDAVACCIAQLVDAQAADEALSGGTGREVMSMSNDGVSMTFVAGTEAARARSSASARNAAIVRDWLGAESTGGVMLLYAGVDA
ncbi:MAG: hypothetical protein E7317_04800 [Clostridiales bacterium]|nr:hypothetical protein [Clostridiales bacterium]